MAKYYLGTDLSTLSDEEIIDLLPKDQADAEIARRRAEVTTTAPGTIPMTPELNKIIEDIGEENLPKKLLKTIKSLRDPTKTGTFDFFGTPFAEQDPEKQEGTLLNIQRDLQEEYGVKPTDPNIGRVMNYLRKMSSTARAGKQLSSSDFLINQAQKLGLINPAQSGVSSFPEFQTAFFDFGMFQNPFQTTTTDVPTVDPGLEAFFAQKRAEEDAREKAIADQAKKDRRARDASQAQESRNQSRDDYTGGGGTVTIGKGGGETKTVSPRSREAMYAAPASKPEPPPFRRFNTGGLAGLEGDTRQLFPVEGGGGLTRRSGPKLIDDRRIGPGLPRRGPFPPNFIGIQPIQPMPLPPLLGVQPSMPDYSSQFEQLGEQLGGFGKQLDALGSFNEQVGGIGKQFEAVNNKLDSLEKGLGSLGNQLASIEQGQPKPQEVQQPQRPSFSPFGLANLFMNMRRF
tara:strand:+ start:116 stop:1486 length:1371 start_codon:yes stop_codon:yes gene_type:complete